MATHITECENKLAALEPENKKLKAEIESVREQMKNTISEASETAAEEVRCLKVRH
jgi:molecular chaperone GrpE (heat shock protein)